MSMALCVFSDRPVESMAEWQAAIYADGFDAKLYEPAVFEELKGFLPVRLDGVGTGFEVSHSDAASLITDLNLDGWDVGRAWTHALEFYFGGDAREVISASCAAASYARVTQGVVFECEEAKFLQPDEALESARQLAVDLKDHLGPARYQWQEQTA